MPEHPFHPHLLQTVLDALDARELAGRSARPGDARTRRGEPIG